MIFHLILIKLWLRLYANRMKNFWSIELKLPNFIMIQVNIL
jgi:hypothetical protein